MLKNYFKIAWRNLTRNKGYTLINILGLALGMVTVLFIALWVWHELSYNRFHEKSDRLYRVISEVRWDATQVWKTTPARLADVLREEIPEIEKVSKITYQRDLLVEVNGETGKEKGMNAEPDFLRMFTFPLIRGDAETSLNNPNSIIITRDFANRYFNGIDPMGKVVRMENEQDFQVTGIMENVPSNSSFQFDFILPQSTFEQGKDWVQRWGVFSFYTFVELRPDATKSEVDQKIENIIAEQTSEESAHHLFLEPITDIHLYDNYVNGIPTGGRIDYVYLFSAIALFILIIACINFMNLATARSVRRAKEVGIRKTSGAGRLDLAGQFIGEAVATAGLSMLTALLLFELLLPYFNNLTGKNLELSLQDPLLLLMLLGITLLTGILSGSYPAFILSSLKPINTLKNNLKGYSSINFRKYLVVFQFTLSIVLMIATTVMYQQINFIQNKNLGYDKENLVLSPLSGDLYGDRELLKELVLKSSSIRSATFVSDYPHNISGSSGDLNWNGKPANQTVETAPLSVGYDFLETMHISLKQGRDFSPDIASDSAAYIINETAARVMGMENPVGKEIEFWLGKGPVVGVVEDFHIASMHEKIKPLILMAMPENAQGIVVRTSPGQTRQAVTALEQAVERLSPGSPFEYHFMDALYEQQYRSEMQVGTLAQAATFLAIFISCLGLFGLALFMAEQRTKEIGIRKVLGATAGNIVRLLSSDFIKLVMLGFLLAIPVAWYATNRWLQDYAYRIDIGLQPFLLAGMAALLIAVVTVSWQSVRAAVANPAKSLRTE